MRNQELLGTAQKLNALGVYRGLLKKPAVGALTALLQTGGQEADAAYGELCAVLAKSPAPHSLTKAIATEVLRDENPFTLACAGGAFPDETLCAMAARDLSALSQACAIAPDVCEKGLPPFPNDPADAPLDKPDWGNCLNELKDYHQQRGCGDFSVYRAFLWRSGACTPVEHPDTISLSDLKEYTVQRQTAIRNTEAFLNGFQANNLLFYGDRGTGKSSTVKALLNAYADRGLRMIEVPKAFLNELPILTDRLAALPMKFIVFIDDLSFTAGDDSFSALKAVLEGGIAAKPANVLLYATSNRRHLLKENFSDRDGDDIHQADTIQESVSLSDRFGITLTYLMPDKEHFLRIVSQMADDLHLPVNRSLLLDAAERWALAKGGRSPRYARQFVIDCQARLARGEAL